MNKRIFLRKHKLCKITKLSIWFTPIKTVFFGVYKMLKLFLQLKTHVVSFKKVF